MVDVRSAQLGRRVRRAGGWKQSAVADGYVPLPARCGSCGVGVELSRRPWRWLDAGSDRVHVCGKRRSGVMTRTSRASIVGKGR